MNRVCENIRSFCSEYDKEIKWISTLPLSILLFSLLYLLPSVELKSGSGGGVDKWGDTTYFSIVTITTLGYGDITPINGSAKMLTALESILGLVLLGIILNVCF